MRRTQSSKAALKIHAEYKKSPDNGLFTWINNEPRKYHFGEHRYEKLAAWPEDAGWSQASRGRVIRVLELSHRAQELLFRAEEATEDAEDLGVQLDDDSPEIANLATELREVLEELNLRLRKYPHYFRVWPGGIVPGRLTMASLPPPKSTICRGEQTAIDELRALINDGQICSLAECDCGRFFYAVKDDQQSCSPKCRHKLYESKLEESNPQAKEQRKAYMREYYLLKKTGKVK